MASRKFLMIDPAKPEGSNNANTRTRIEDAAIALMAEGAHLNHDAVAERAGISRRTVYRYFPDQEALRTGMGKRLSLARRIPADLDEWIHGFEERFARFDANADAMTVALSSTEGRAIRNVMTAERAAAFRDILAKPTAALPEPDRTRAIAGLQFLSSGFAWQEMREQWGLTAPDMATACRWMMETLLADLERRGSTPLSEGPAR